MKNLAKNDGAKSPTALSLIITLLVIVFIADILINILTGLFSLGPVPESLVDGFLVIFLAYPALYLLIFRPLSREIIERKRSEKELRRLAAIVESSDDAIIGKTMDGKIVTWNHGAEKIYGYAAGEATGKPISIIAPPERKDEMFQILDRIKHGVPYEHYETIRMKKNGEKIHVSLTISPIYDTSGRMIGISTISRDITEQKITEELLRHAKERAELLFRISPSAIFTMDKDLHITSWNDKAEKITGYSREDVMSKVCPVLAGLPCSKEGNLKINDDAKPVMGHECNIVTKNGRTLTVLKNIDYLRDSKGRISVIIESFEDITDSKKLEDELRESRDYLNEIINSVADPVFVKDRQHRWVLVNEAYCSFMGYAEKELLGRTDRDFFPPKEADLFWEKDEEVFKSGEENLSEENFTDRSGIVHIISTKKRLYTDIKGERFIVGIIRDITERKRIERLKDEFIGTVSHELRTPLSITKEGISLVLDNIPGPINEQQSRILTVSKNNIDRLARIINSLLDISRIESGKMDIRHETFDILAIIRQVAGAFELKIREKNLAMRTSLPKDGITIRGDTDAVAQVLTNLIGNSYKFTNNGFIEVSAKDAGDSVEISIADTGIGISREDMPKLFEKFQQFGRVSGPGEKGTGLGLAIAKGIVIAHKGKIWVESEPGKGTKVSFTLPKEI
ncbi:MAG: PAS domain S-box protein [Candidatus Omnitrophica bacterium]|nr:PAS domain S-box protein [Candidatus Omnitrophota bacterium]